MATGLGHAVPSAPMFAMDRQAVLHVLALLVVLVLAATGHAVPATACAPLLAGDGGALQPCLDSLPEGATLALPPARYTLTRPVTFHRRVTLTTAGLPPSAPRCPGDGTGCALLALRMAGPAPGQPITLAAPGIVLDHLTVEGTRLTPDRPGDAALCRGPARATMGGLSLKAPNITITHSVLRDMACFSAAVAESGADGLHFTGNAVLSNGTHERAPLWADGLTVTDATNDVIRGNLFRDNTDVQLVLGGCLRCTVADNRFAATADPAAASFAALLLHGWPHTSGDYAGTLVTANTIDCGPAHACGVGLGIGGRAWYDSPTSGGTVAGNTVRRAAIGISVNDATGPVTMARNTVTESGGLVATHCGPRSAGAVNIAPRSARFVSPSAGTPVPPDAVSHLDLIGCLPGLP